MQERVDGQVCQPPLTDSWTIGVGTYQSLAEKVLVKVLERRGRVRRVRGRMCDMAKVRVVDGDGVR